MFESKFEKDLLLNIHKYHKRFQIEVVDLHVCTVHQQYQSTFYYSKLMHTIIKS